MRRSITLASLALVAGFVTFASPASADPRWDRGRHEGWRHQQDRREAWRHERWRGGPRYGYGYGRGYAPPPPVYYAPRRAYAPPPGVYIPFR